MTAASFAQSIDLFSEIEQARTSASRLIELYNCAMAKGTDVVKAIRELKELEAQL